MGVYLSYKRPAVIHCLRQQRLALRFSPLVCSLYSNNSATPQSCRTVVCQRKKAVYFIPLPSPGSLSVAIQPLSVNIFRSSFH